MIYRRIVIVLSGIILSIAFSLFLDIKFVWVSKNAKLVAQIYQLGSETDMNDAQIARTIGTDPMRVLRHSYWIGHAEELVVYLVGGIFVACFERQMPASLTALVLAPHIIWASYWSIFLHRTHLQPAAVVMDVGIRAASVALAILASVAVARLFSRRTRIVPVQQEHV